MEHAFEGLGHILAVQVAPDVGSVAVDRQRLSLHCEEDELGDQLLRELVGSVDVVAARGDARKVVGAVVGHNEHLSAGLRCGVWVGWEELRSLMVADDGFRLGLAVHFISRDVDKTLDLAAGDLASLEEDVGAVDVVLGEFEGVAEGVVNVGLSGEVHDGVDALGDEEVVHEIGGRDVALDELEIRGGFRGHQILQIGAVVQLVQHHDLVVRVVADQPVGDMGCNEARRSRDQNVLRLVRALARPRIPHRRWNRPRNATLLPNRRKTSHNHP